jgi:hypothetical protein
MKVAITLTSHCNLSRKCYNVTSGVNWGNTTQLGEKKTMAHEDRKESMAIIQAALDQAAHEKDLFTYQEAAKELNRSLSSVQRAASEGILHPISRRGTNMKFIHRDEVEWFKDKTLSHVNAILYQDAKRQQEPEPEKTWHDRIAKFLTDTGAPTGEELITQFGLGMLSLALLILKEDDEDSADAARVIVPRAVKTLQLVEEGRAKCRELAPIFLEILTSEKEKLPYATRKVLKETLDLLLDITEEQESPLSASA